MTHISTAQCADIVRGALGPRERSEVDRHTEVCEACAEAVRFWHRLADMGVRDQHYDPPMDVVEAAHAYAAPRPCEEHSVLSRAVERVQAFVATLTLDTLEQALPAGVRSGASVVRQLLYEAPQLAIDLRLENARRPDRIMLAGQIASRERPGAVGEGIRVALVAIGIATEVAAVMTNRFGEFQCEFDRRDDLSLSIALKDGRAIEIRLDRLPAVGDAGEGGHGGHNGRKGTI